MVVAGNVSQTIKFEKYQANGNNFIIIDERLNDIDNISRSELAVMLCNRKLSVSADGVLFLQQSDLADVRMRIFEPDGSESSMCGNGTRCVTLYIYNSQGSTNLSIETVEGIVYGNISTEGVQINVGHPQDPTRFLSNPERFIRLSPTILQIEHDNRTFYILNIGEPHAVIIDNDFNIDLRQFIDLLTDHELFPQGINLNLISITGPGSVRNRTFERGVWDYTSSCGTGSVCSAIIAREVYGLDQAQIQVINDIGSQLIRFTKDGIITLAMPVYVFTGYLVLD